MGINKNSMLWPCAQIGETRDCFLCQIDPKDKPQDCGRIGGFGRKVSFKYQGQAKHFESDVSQEDI